MNCPTCGRRMPKTVGLKFAKPLRTKGRGCRVSDRDEAEKHRRGYIESGSFVRRDGSERLVGHDWRMRKEEVSERAGATCEMWRLLKKPHVAYCSLGDASFEVHHIVKRSTKRDDRASNLVYLSHDCHASLDSRKIGGRKKEAVR